MCNTTEIFLIDINKISQYEFYNVRVLHIFFFVMIIGCQRRQITQEDM